METLKQEIWCPFQIKEATVETGELVDPTTQMVDHNRRDLWKKVKRSIGGGIAVLLIVATWILMAQIIGKIQKESKYQKAFLMAYVVHSGYAFAIIPYVIWYFVCRFRFVSFVFSLILAPFYRPRDHVEQEITSKFLLQTAVLSFWLAIVAYTWYFSLSRTTLSANTAIYNCSPALVYFFSIFILNDSITPLKVFSVIACVGGVVVVSMFGSNSDSPDSVNTVFGLLMVTLSAFTFAIYEVILGKILPHSETLSKSLLTLGFLGIWSFLLLWPIFFILHFTGIEPFVLPYRYNLASVVITTALDLVLNIALLVGVQISGPLFISIGSLLTIPSSVLIDHMMNNYTLPWHAFLGIGLIVLGFLGINFANINCEFNTRYSWKLNLKFFGNEETEDDQFPENQMHSETNNLINSKD